MDDIVDDAAGRGEVGAPDRIADGKCGDRIVIEGHAQQFANPTNNLGRVREIGGPGGNEPTGTQGKVKAPCRRQDGTEQHRRPVDLRSRYFIKGHRIFQRDDDNGRDAFEIGDQALDPGKAGIEPIGGADRFTISRYAAAASPLNFEDSDRNSYCCWASLS